MGGRNRGEIAASLVRGREQFEAWRRSRNVGARIPDKLWVLAVKLAGERGVSRTASVLKLDYHGLKKRVPVKSSPAPDASAAFVEITPSAIPVPGECIVEFEDVSGARMRVHLRGCDTPDLVALGRSFWSGE